jgi:hypothetical protein
VPSGHDGVAALLLEDRIAQDRLELGPVAPGVELGIGDRPVEVGLLAAIGVEFAGIGRVGGLAPVVGGGVGAARDRTGHADADLLAFLLGHQLHGDRTEELARELDAFDELLLDRRGDGELDGGVGDAVDQRDLADIAVEADAGLVAHGKS